MKCPRCNIEARISRSRYVTENDDNPDKQTKLFLEQSFTCRNPQCTDYGKVIRTVRNPLRLEKD